MDPDTTSTTSLPAATLRYPRNRWVQLLRNCLFLTGVAVITFVALTVTDPYPDKLGTVLGNVLFPFGQPGEGIILALVMLGAAWAVYDEVQEMRQDLRQTRNLTFDEWRLRRGQEEEPRARKDYERAHRRGKRRKEMDALDRLANALNNQKRDEEAMQAYQMLLDLSEALNDAEMQYSSLRMMAFISERQGAFDAAQRFYERRVHVARDMKGRGWLVEALEEFASFAQERGDLSLAESLFRENVAMTRNEGLTAYSPDALAQLGAFLVSARGEREQGCAMIREAAEQCHTRGDTDAEEDIRDRMRELGCE